MIQPSTIIHNNYIDIITYYPLGSSYPKTGSCYASTFIKMQYNYNKDIVFYKVLTP